MRIRKFITVPCKGCGDELRVRSDDVRRHHGYHRRCNKPNLRHGHASHVNGATLTFKCWSSMFDRCYNPSCVGYPNYGARGIAVCERWTGAGGFENFRADMGEKPVGRSLDRIDNEGNYEPGNCRWATSKQQSRNTRATRLSEEDVRRVRGWLADGSTSYAIAKRLGVSAGCVDGVRRGTNWKDVS